MDEFGGLLAKYLIIALALACFYPIIPTAWNSSYIVQFRYDVGLNKIIAPPRPTECDFLTAPLGLKQCRYDVEIIEDGGFLHVRWLRISSE